MLTPCNFVDHKFVKTNIASLMEEGFMIGSKVELVRKITVEFGPDKFRKDVMKGTTSFIKGFADDRPVVSFKSFVGKTEYESDVRIKTANLKLYTPPSDAEAGGKKTGSAAGSKASTAHDFLLTEGENASKIDVVEGWEARQCSADDKYMTQAVALSVACALSQVAQCAPKFTSKDLLVVKRGAAFEVWTQRAFKANELILVPETLDVRDRFWSAGKAVLVDKSEDLLRNVLGPLHRKPLVADGRYRASPGDATRAFSLFWLVTASKDKDKDCVNMEIVHTDVAMNMDGMLPGGTKIKQHYGATSVPLMVNPKPLAAKTKLVVMEDPAVKSLADKETTASLTDKAKTVSSIAVPKSASGASSASSDPSSITAKAKAASSKAPTAPKAKGKGKAKATDAAAAPDATKVESAPVDLPAEPSSSSSEPAKKKAKTS